MFTKLYFDGAHSSVVGGSCGFILDGLLRFEETHHLPDSGSAMETEYAALIMGLNKAIDLGISMLEVIGDSRGVLDGAAGKTRHRDPELKKLAEETTALLALIPEYVIRWVPSGQNPADEISRIRRTDTVKSYWYRRKR